MGRLLVIGLDGVTFDLITPWAREGKLPHLAKLMEDGVHGVLHSTVPPMSPPAWTSFVTGKNPGKHGIFDFTIRKPGSYAIEFVNARWRQAPTIWKMMSEAGKRVCVIAVPISYPPEQLNGIMISGIDTPGATGGVADSTAFSPSQLHAELLQAVGPYFISPNLVAFGDDQCDAMVEAALQTIDRKVATALHLFGKEAWDCFMLVLGETDSTAHRLWKYHDKHSPLADAQVVQYTGEDPLWRIYQRVDQHLGTFCRMAPEDTTILIMSDHGQGGNGTKVVYLNRWLEEQQLLRFKMAPQGGGVRSLGRRLLTQGVQRAKALSLKCLPPTIKRKVLRNTPLANKLESWLRFSHIDWLHTQAYSEETPYFPTVWINLHGREPAGIVSTDEYETVRERIIQALHRWVEPETGQRVVKRVYKREEVFSGPFVTRFPDLIIEWNLDQGYSYLFKSSRGAPGCASIARVEGQDKAQSKSADHRDDGICIAVGPYVKQHTVLGDAHLLDLAPTMMYLLGLPVPKDMDGKVLIQIVTDEYLVAHPVTYEHEASAPVPLAESPEDYSDAEAEAIRARLKGLGYIE